jgi:superfamily II DNA helicase RecQ
MLQAGSNQVTIVGLTPTIDEHSVKVVGTDSVVITDLVVELLPNRELFDDVYCENSDDDGASEPDSSGEDSSDDDVPGHLELKTVQDQLFEWSNKLLAANEMIRCAESRLEILNAYGKSLGTDGETYTNIRDGLETYRVEWERIFCQHLGGEAQTRKIGEKLASLKKVEDRLVKRLAKDRAKAYATKKKQMARQRRKNLEQVKEKERLRQEREAFWPRKVYTVKVTLEVASSTPATSRRSSIASKITQAVVDKHGQDTQAGSNIATCDLSLCYGTSYAYWSPTYDLALSTITNSGVLCFDARLIN